MIVMLNHKMNLLNEDILNYINKLEKYKNKFTVFPSSIYAKDFINNGFRVGLQNIHFENSGPYTGEISPKQFKSIGGSYVLIGHSERRKYFNETNDIINKKIKKALENKLKVVLCIYDDIDVPLENLKQNLLECLKEVKEKIILAYEPVYAIGTNQPASLLEIEKKVSYIKTLYDYPTLYGGSVNKENISTLKNIKNLDGFLIGSASLNAEDVRCMLEVVC